MTADEEEQRRLIRLIFAVSHKNGWTEEDLRKAIKGAFGHDSTKQLSWVQTTRLKQLIEMKKTVDQVVNELKGTR